MKNNGKELSRVSLRKPRVLTMENFATIFEKDIEDIKDLIKSTAKATQTGVEKRDE